MLSGITISFRVKPGKPRFWLTALEADFKQNICKAIKLYKVKTAWHPNIYLLRELICVVFLCKLPGVIMHKDSEQNYRCSVCSSGLILQEKKKQPQHVDQSPIMSQRDYRSHCVEDTCLFCFLTGHISLQLMYCMQKERWLGWGRWNTQPGTEQQN